MEAKPKKKKKLYIYGSQEDSTEAEGRVYPHPTKARRLQKGI